MSSIIKNKSLCKLLILAAGFSGLMSTTLFSNPWYWFLTHLRLSINTKHINCSVSKFDPAVRIYDKDTTELIATLQRITIEGKNTESPDEGITVNGYSLEGDRELLLVHDNGTKILSLEVGGEENKLFSYDNKEEIDLRCTTKGLLLVHGLIRLSPSYVFVPKDQGGVENFFKELQKEEK